MSGRTYAALLRGVSPMNAPSAALREAFEAAGFADVRTVIASGNVVFTAGARLSPATIRRRAEDALEERLGRRFLTILRPIEALRGLLAADPWQQWPVPDGAKRVVTFFLAEPETVPELPLARAGATLYAVRGAEAYCAYVPSARGGEFMGVIERTFGKDITTRTWDTVRRIAR